MNNWVGIGRLTKDVEVRYSGETAVGRFTLAIDDGYGEKKKTDFVPVVCFNKTAENAEKFLSTGKLCAVQGKYTTGKYENKEGVTVYTTEITASRVQFLESKNKAEADTNVPDGFIPMDDLDDSIPF